MIQQCTLPRKRSYIALLSASSVVASLQSRPSLDSSFWGSSLYRMACSGCYLAKLFRMCCILFFSFFFFAPIVRATPVEVHTRVLTVQFSYYPVFSRVLPLHFHLHRSLLHIFSVLVFPWQTDS